MNTAACSPLPKRFSHRVAVYRGFALTYKSSAAAEHLLSCGLATIRRRSGRTITELDLTNAATGYTQGRVRADELGLRAGSFGIRVEALPGGLQCFAHRNPWTQVEARSLPTGAGS